MSAHSYFFSCPMTSCGCTALHTHHLRFISFLLCSLTYPCTCLRTHATCALFLSFTSPDLSVHVLRSDPSPQGDSSAVFVELARLLARVEGEGQRQCTRAPCAVDVEHRFRVLAQRALRLQLLTRQQHRKSGSGPVLRS